MMPTKKISWRFMLVVVAINIFTIMHSMISLVPDSRAEIQHHNYVGVTSLRGRRYDQQGKDVPTKRALEEHTQVSHPTGAFANCEEHVVTTGSPHPDQKVITISCHTFPYRMPTIDSAEDIFIGVLSGAGGEGPARRMSIRNTWAREHSVFFIVAGPWEIIEAEYQEFGDLIWIDREEVYDGEKSVLTFKTMTFMKISHGLTTNMGLRTKYAFKTDDDSFVNVDYLHEFLLQTSREEDLDYWGKCSEVYFEPSRDPNYKWSISRKLYPEKFYPKYCQGAGFALSQKFLDCAAGPEDHLAHMRFMPFEDTAVGLLAERCGLEPTNGNDRLFNQFRTPLKEEHTRVRHSEPKIDKSKLTVPDMEGRIVQHRIHDEWDMMEHYNQVRNPTSYKEIDSSKWYSPKYEEIYRWREDKELNPEAKK